jgi:prepilin-type processing-associated H-X9-DG protein
VAHWVINYGVNEGTWMVFDPYRSEGGDGAFMPNRGCTYADFTDGTSNTLGIAEVKAYNPAVRNGGNPNVFGAPLPGSPAEVLALGGSFKADSNHTEWVDGKVHETGFTTLFPPNTRVEYTNAGASFDVDFVSASEGNADNRYTYAAVTSRSYHSGGIVNGLLMDGSVRTFSSRISVPVWRALGTRSGGEVIGDGY